MGTEAKVYQQRNNELDVISVARSLLENWWVILLCGCIMSMWAYMAVSLINTPVYVSQATLVITNNGNDNSVYTDDAMSKVANQYQKILSSTALRSTVQEELGLDSLPGTIRASVVPDTNLILLQGVASKPGDAYLLAKSAVKNYSKVSSYVISSFSLEEMKAPGIPTVSSDAGRERRWALRGLLLGMAAAAAVICLIDFLRDDIKNERQVGSLLDTTLFGSLYFEKKKRGKQKTSILISSPVTSFLYAENIRKVATKLDFKMHKADQKVVLVTSVLENEGKSTVAANLALALAGKNRRVLLIDGDLRKPSLHKIFEKEIEAEMEIGSCLKGDTTAQAALTRDKDTGLYYMFGTKSYRNSDQLLSSKKMKDVLKAARKAVDYIVIDSSPTSITSDAEIIAENADAALLVVRQGAARVADINDTLDKLKKSDTEVLGCILNAVQTKILPKAAEYGYSYGYGGNYGYHNKYGNYYHRKNSSESKDQGN